MFAQSLLILLASSSLIDARSVHEQIHGLVHRRAANDDATSTVLSADAIQSGSFNNGLLETGAETGEAASLTSQNNFINNCRGKTLTNGLQITTGSCNGIPMGDIPAKTSMISSVITFPLPGSKTIQSDTTFNITVQTLNLVAGSFTNADATYYAAPQALSGGKVVGHTHVTVQDMGSSLNPTTPLDATQFAFFKGINDAGNGEGLLTATVTGGLPAGNYRVCTLTSASNHQPVIMPVAQRGSQDDCTKFTVVGNGTTINAAANDGSKGIAAAAAAAAAVSLGPDVNVPSSANSTSTSTSEKATNTQGGKGGKGSTTTTSQSTSTAKSGNGNGNGSGKGSTSVANGNGASKVTSAVQAISTTVVQKVTVIESFFEFSLSLGGLPPSVSKKGDSFFVLEQLFEDITEACGAACEQQFTTCTSLSGPGFSFEECSSQKEQCGSAASTATSTASPLTITATVTVPPTAAVTGSILSETTIATSFTPTPSASPVAANAANSTATNVADLVASSTQSAAAQSSNTTAVTPNASALGGITAPAITDSGDSSRPFEVNGNTFVNKAAAVQRSCDIQFNACADAFNSGNASGFNISDCQTQENNCISAGGS